MEIKYGCLVLEKDVMSVTLPFQIVFKHCWSFLRGVRSMINKVFQEGDWIIYAHDYTFNLEYSHYSQHKSCETDRARGLMDWDHRKCYDCGEIVPDNIQTILYLLVCT